MTNIPKITTTIVALVLLATPLASRAQCIITDSIIPERIVVKSTLLGVAGINNLDTYLSGYDYKGASLYLQHENFRDARTGDYRWKYQTMLNGMLGYATQGNNSELATMVSYSWGGYHQFTPCDRLKLLAGAQIQLEGGALYIPSNGNNPVAAKLRTALAASGMAIYRIPAKAGNYILRCQADVPLAGVMFAPEFGQSYYEIFGLGHYDNTIKMSHPGNNPSLRTTLAADIPLQWGKRGCTVRLAYTADIFQSEINDIRTHLYNHMFTIGFVKTIYKVKKEDKAIQYTPY